MIFLFIHIAKAAGSSVNSFFQHKLGEEACLVHQESNPDWRKPDVPLDMLDGIRFVSGHIPYRVFTKWLEKYDLHTITVLRDPRSHVVSHLAWIRHLMDPGQEVRLAAHPEFIQTLAKKLASINFEVPKEIESLISNLTEHEWRLLDNPQVRYLTRYPHGGSGMQEKDASSALETLRKIDTFGFTEEPQSLFESLAEAVGDSGQRIDAPHENALGYRYGLDAENEFQMQALMPLIKHDLNLYREARNLYKDRNKKNEMINSQCHHFRGNVGSPNKNGVLPGWAFDAESNKSIKVDVYVNKRFYRNFEAAISRKDLREKFDRDCAFIININDLKAQPGDEISVFFQNTDEELNGSPCIVPELSETVNK